MKTLKSLIIIGLAIILVAGISFSQKKTTVYGEVVELTSFVKDNIKPTSPAGKEISLENVKKGGSFVLLEKGTGKIVFLIAGTQTKLDEQLAPYLGIKVFIKGAVYKKGGIRLISVEDIGKYLK